jgi:hypothetical protein
MNDTDCRRIVRTRSGGVCEVCGRARATSQHHRRKAGRVSVPSNVLDTCGDGTTGCHGDIEANPDRSRASGWWVDTTDDPATVPVVHAAWPWRVLLDDEGLLTPWHGGTDG